MTIKGILVSLTLEHQFFSIFMATYLPTILLNIINQESWLKKLLKLNCKHMQATNYVQGDLKYDMILTLNITSLMVLTSIYLSVSASLPNTSVIKPIEEWLLFNLTYPFMVILVNIAMQVYIVQKMNLFKCLNFSLWKVYQLSGWNLFREGKRWKLMERKKSSWNWHISGQILWTQQFMCPFA